MAASGTELTSTSQLHEVCSGPQSGLTIPADATSALCQDNLSRGCRLARIAALTNTKLRWC
jgi:hypothetical protein